MNNIPEFEITFPIIVIGAGACGSIAALAAREAGVEVLLVEQDRRPMGSTGMSQGLISAAGTQAQLAAGIVDSADLFYRDIMAKTDGQADPVIAELIAAQSGPTLDWMVNKLHMPWQLDKAFRPGFGNSTYRVHGWPGHSGQAMVDLLQSRLLEAEVNLLLGAQLTEVHADDSGRVLGVTLRRPDGAEEQVGCEALILACGGFAANHELVQRYIPAVISAKNHGHEGSQGMAVKVGLQLGAALGDMGAYQGYGMLTEPQGITVSPGTIVGGGLLVNSEGNRFVDELADIAGVVLPVLQQPGDHVWVVFDEKIEAQVASYPESQQLMELNAAKKADTLAELAALMGVPVENLQATFDAVQAASSAQAEDQLGRDWRGVQPPSGRYCALKVVGAIYHTQGGLQINSAAQVVRGNGSPLPNLFAGGGAARSVSGPAHWGYIPAMGLATAVVLGRMAGTRAAELVLRGGE
ncbi:FAD-dependent oxidoreductase [Halioxenophilus sp. WMMB6]|uniref:FAD-dependent oxidoreductase n=1 Tax=Halioxenophilus sp. WMMB6 TaxID=3073815 RepID=UPI00295ECE07|nr:FAD-dependent oxidoreductase [Halioxenophilus sp. WMMB6]